MKEEKERIAKYLRMPEMLGKDNLNRLKVQKEELDQLRKDIDEQENEKAYLLLQRERMTGEYKQIHKILEKYREEI